MDGQKVVFLRLKNESAVFIQKSRCQIVIVVVAAAVVVVVVVAVAAVAVVTTAAVAATAVVTYVDVLLHLFYISVASAPMSCTTSVP